MAYSKTTQYTCLYEGMRGVDFSAESTERRRFSYLENMWRDYDGDGNGESCTESIPGFRRLLKLPGKIHAIYRQSTEKGVYVVVHAGGYCYRFPLDARDSIGQPTRLSTISDGDSCAISVGDTLYLWDGAYMRLINQNGDMGPVDDTGFAPYKPTLYENGEPFEQRNLLTDRFRETYTVAAADAMAYGTPHLSYEEAADVPDAVYVTGIGEGESITALYIPARVSLGGRSMRVIGIADGAFEGNTSIREVHVAHGVETVGARAFAECALLSIVVLHDSVVSVGTRAFEKCSWLTDLYLGQCFASLGDRALEGCNTLQRVHYAGSDEELAAIEGREGIREQASCLTGVKRRDIRLQIPVYSPAIRMSSLTLDGEELDYTALRDGDRITSFYTDLPDRTALYDKTFIIEGRLSRTLCAEGDGMFSFLTSYPSYTGTTASVIHGCTVCAAFDGRIFLSGHPALPGLVFYSQRNRGGVNDPTYFGVLNYFVDGIGPSPVVGMLATSDALAIFKREDDGAGGIYYHKPQATEHLLVPKIYPVAYAHNGLGSYGACLSFLDDPVFVGPSGIQALDRKDLSSERSIGIRSHAISARLLHEDLSAIRLCRWMGYLVVSVGGHMYLADSRSTYHHSSGHTEYEWYYLDGIGTYEDDTPVYRYASLAPEGVHISEHVEERVPSDKMVFNFIPESGERHLCVSGKDGRREAVYMTEERQGGRFSPACAIAALDELLLFGTEDGTVCIFNNDKRGIPPERIASAEGFDAETYRAVNGRRIHPDFYSFDGHAPRYALKTVSDNVGIPHMSKRTVPRSLTVKCRSGAARRLIIEVGTDHTGYTTVATLPAVSVCFEDMDFSALVWEQEATVTVPIREKQKHWIEKQITIYSDEFCSPIGISSLAYRYTVEGRIKQK